MRVSLGLFKKKYIGINQELKSKYKYKMSIENNEVICTLKIILNTYIFIKLFITKIS